MEGIEPAHDEEDIDWKQIGQKYAAEFSWKNYVLIQLILRLVHCEGLHENENGKCKLKLLGAVEMLILRTMKWELHLNLWYMQLKSLSGAWTYRDF